MDEALISLPENSSLKFLMPSRRHHPQVEPLLATYKNLLLQKVAKTFLSLQGTNFIAKKCWLLKTLGGLTPLSIIFTVVFILHSEILLISKKEYCCKVPFPLFLVLSSSPHEIPHFHVFFSLSPSPKPFDKV